MAKNLILLTIECLRADHTHFLGYSRNITPTLDELAKKGKVFSNAMATSSWTAPSFFSIHTCLYPFMYGESISPPLDVSTLAETLKRNGYKTAAFHGCSAVLSRHFGWGKGFDVYDEWSLRCYEKNAEGFIRKLENIENPYLSDPLRLCYMYVYYMFLNNKDKQPLCNLKAISWLRRNLNCNKFLWIHYRGPHEPYCSPSRKYISINEIPSLWKINNKSLKNLQTRKHGEVELSEQEVNRLVDLYDLEIKKVDQAIKYIIRVIKLLGIYDNTYFIITADHGQEFFDHGGFSHQLHLHNELVHVPLIILGPDLQPEKVDSVVSLIDIAPTILDLLGVEESSFLLGNSLFDEQKREEKAKFGVIIEESKKRRNQSLIRDGVLRFSNLKESVWAIVTNDYKYIFKKEGENELYDRREDPKETNNILHYKPNIAKKLEKRIRIHIQFEESYNKKMIRSEPRQKIAQQQEQKIKQRLRALGYI